MTDPLTPTDALLAEAKAQTLMLKKINDKLNFFTIVLIIGGLLSLLF